MKNLYIYITVIILASFLLMPLLAVDKHQKGSEQNISVTSKLKESEKGNYLKEFRVYFSDEKKVVNLSVTEYLTGVLAAEMSAEYNTEALKAQAVAAYTYTYHKHLQNSNADYDITTDSSIDQAYLSLDKRKEKWGENYEEYNKKVTDAINAVEGKIITYNNQPILAVYHAISSGNTETAKNVWGVDYPYLQKEVSVGDLLAPNFLSEKSVSKEEFTKTVTELGCTVTGDPKNYIGKSTKSDSGTVLSIKICSKDIKGADIRDAFDLRSSNFEITFSEDKFLFTVSGYGHGVGMSQFGANYMAEQGSDYVDIIKAYYRGVAITDLK